MIYFKEDTHQYFTEKGTPLASVSKLLGMVKQPFDKEYWLKKKADERGITPEELEKEWDHKRDIAIERGNKYHWEYEKKLNAEKTSYPTQYDSKDKNIKYSYDLFNLSPGVYPELIIYNKKHRLAGTSDIVEIYADNTFDIRDHKTNKELKFESYKKYDPVFGSKFHVMMQHPVSHLMDCNGMHYSIQLSVYAYMLEQFGYKCNSLTLHHVIFDENDEPVNIVDYPLNYLKKEAQTLLQWYKSNLK